MRNEIKDVVAVINGYSSCCIDFEFDLICDVELLTLEKIFNCVVQVQNCIGISCTS